MQTYIHTDSMAAISTTSAVCCYRVAFYPLQNAHNKHVSAVFFGSSFYLQLCVANVDDGSDNSHEHRAARLPCVCAFVCCHSGVRFLFLFFFCFLFGLLLFAAKTVQYDSSSLSSRIQCVFVAIY